MGKNKLTPEQIFIFLSRVAKKEQAGLLVDFEDFSDSSLFSSLVCG